MTHRSIASRLALLLPLLAAGAAAGCEPSVSPQFSIDEPGSVEGLLFFDKDEDGVFDPSDGDYALPGVQIQIRVRGGTDVIAGGNLTSDAGGRFTAASLPAGTHDAYVNTATLPAGVVLCSNPVPVTVEPGVTRFFSFQTKGGCLVLISVAEAQPLGTVVVVRGIVISAPGQIRSGYTHIQDASGGIRIFASSLEGQGIAVGDRIEVSGTLAAFNQDLQITSPTLRARDPAFGSVAPNALTTAAIAAAGDPKNPLVGTLVRITKAQVSGFGTGSNARNATVNDGSGATQVRIESAVGATEAAAQALMTAGKCYNVTGPLGTFNGTAQVFPRTTADIVEVPCT